MWLKDIKRSTTFSYKPYVPLEGQQAQDVPGAPHLAAIEQLVENGSYAGALNQTSQLIATTLEGLRYLQT